MTFVKVVLRQTHGLWPEGLSVQCRSAGTQQSRWSVADTQERGRNDGLSHMLVHVGDDALVNQILQDAGSPSGEGCHITKELFRQLQ
ncbi:hypothetical protein ACFFV7_08000 [Nonomuraea spiralis]|uniref:Uncharacterized protein n=1 Tax=Nonomuraea spiralis TaxID=46182 RepID=A0ABV5I9X0_9ACTN|nr:hypothetical protein [Nonomuraea spiralis]